MKIIYHDVGGAHSTAMAAAIHLRILPNDRVPSTEEIMDIGFFDTMEKKDRGKILYRGKDEFGNEVYTLGRQFNKELVLNAVKDAYTLGGGHLEEVLLIDTMNTVNILMKIGGFSSRRLHLVSFGRPIVLKGSQNSYPDVIKLVEDTKGKLRSH